MDTERRSDGPRTAPAQLRLLDTAGRAEWRLDEATREAGRRGVQLAREALRASRRRATSADEADAA